MKIKSTIITIGMATVMMASLSACQQAQRENPLLTESELSFGAIDFNKIETTDYLPAFEAAIQQKRENIQKIVDCPDSATFENTNPCQQRILRIGGGRQDT